MAFFLLCTVKKQNKQKKNCKNNYKLRPKRERGNLPSSITVYLMFIYFKIESHEQLLGSVSAYSKVNYSSYRPIISVY